MMDVFSPLILSCAPQVRKNKCIYPYRIALEIGSKDLDLDLKRHFVLDIKIGCACHSVHFWT